MPARLEELLTGVVTADGDGVRRSKTWANYRAGERVPVEYSIELAETRFPGTRRYFDSPLWQALKGELRSAEDGLAAISKMSEPIPSAIIRRVNGRVVLNPIDLSWRLRSFRSFEGFAALCVLYATCFPASDVFTRAVVVDEVLRFELDEGFLITPVGEEVRSATKAWIASLNDGTANVLGQAVFSIK